MGRYVEEHYSSEFNAKPLNCEVELLLQGEDPYAAMAAAAEAEAAEKEDGMEVKEEEGFKRDYFEPASSFQGARPGWCFKMGMRGLGYYRDAKQEVKEEKRERPQPTVKEEDEEKDTKVEKK